jgi:hypothetical protein
MGDSTSALNGEVVNHSYLASGVYSIVASITMNHPRVSQLTLTHTVKVLESETDLNKCPTVGETRERITTTRNEVRACGVQGQQNLQYQTTLTERCDLVGQHRDWQTVSEREDLLSTGACEGQSCELPSSSILGVDLTGMNIQVIGGKYLMSHNQTLTFYSTRNAPESCSALATTRTCNNGTLSGSSTHSELMCNNGCGSFGVHGTVQTGVITGEREVSKTCAFNETGIFDVFNELSDLACNQGQIQSSNIRLGEVKVPGVCPSYQWQATDIYSSCSADCGGQQSRQFICQDDKGNLASEDRCGVKPVESRLCDGNPEAVRRTETHVETEESGSSITCPSNQIGVIIQEREVTTTQNFACLNHQVALENETVAYGPWVEERYCRDYVPRRCSHDSLSINEAKGRLAWMQKCRTEVPVIEEFLTQFEDLEVKRKTKEGTQVSTIDSGRLLYPTFMNRSTLPESVWKAPTKESTSCTVPADIYIAAVCVASCATPEQEILAQADKGAKMQPTTFIESLTKKYDFVATLHSNSTMSSKVTKSTLVEDWVTELVDSEHLILNFKMRSGGTLRITPNHPLVTAEGKMQLAELFKVGDSLVKLGGVADQILEIKAEAYFGKVYNVFVKSNDLKHNVVVTNGYLNGTAFYQNEGAKNLNRQILRGRIIKGALPR